ncbi:Transcriptional regulator [Lacticaseibacillus paracasei subsp. paracasei Lpp230]|nr:Transcriptional regulator [Lacticaseibacillus paracasei subsp. paracasei Lpp230]
MSLQEKIAHRIHNLRLSKSMTQEQLAEKANMDVSMLARIERGSRGDIRISTLERIVKGLDVSLQEFLRLVMTKMKS